MRNIIILILACYFLVLLQTSFMVYLNISGIVLNLTLIFVALINLFEKQEKNLGLASAFIGGFFLDIFSNGFFGFYISISLIIYFFFKFILRKYVRIPAF